MPKKTKTTAKKAATPEPKKRQYTTRNSKSRKNNNSAVPKKHFIQDEEEEEEVQDLDESIQDELIRRMDEEESDDMEGFVVEDEDEEQIDDDYGEYETRQREPDNIASRTRNRSRARQNDEDDVNTDENDEYENGREDLEEDELDDLTEEAERLFRRVESERRGSTYVSSNCVPLTPQVPLLANVLVHRLPEKLFKEHAKEIVDVPEDYTFFYHAERKDWPSCMYFKTMYETTVVACATMGGANMGPKNKKILDLVMAGRIVLHKSTDETVTQCDGCGQSNRRVFRVANVLDDDGDTVTEQYYFGLYCGKKLSALVELFNAINALRVFPETKQHISMTYQYIESIEKQMAQIVSSRGSDRDREEEERDQQQVIELDE